MDKKDGLVIVYTGNGKGKTTAAIGIAFRASGYKMHTGMVQFVKGAMYSGELESSKMLSPYFDLYPMGKGFVGLGDSKISFEEHVSAAETALQLVRDKMLSNHYQIIICDEINNAVKLKLIDVKNVISLINEKPESMHLILTGRDADERIIDMADLVTEMREVKHPFKKGIKAQKGIDF